MKDYVRERHLGLREMFVPLAHPPGHAQADFGEADAIIAGNRRPPDPEAKRMSPGCRRTWHPGDRLRGPDGASCWPV